MSQSDPQFLSSSSATTRGSSEQNAPGNLTTPLRIAKTRRDTVQTQLARRQSSSYNHVRNNNLVTNSPFKRFTRIPTPRKVSGEKSGGSTAGGVDGGVDEVGGVDAENKDPAANAYRIKRKQSRSFREVEKGQPVSKSPFLNKRLPAMPSRLMSTPPKPTVKAASPSPRSSLVSKRLRGPRSVGSSPTSTPGRRNRRKTVTFDERCDVVEFEAESSEQSMELNEHGVFGPSHDSSQEIEDPNALIDSILQDTLMNVNPDDSLISLDSSIPSLTTPPMSPQPYLSPNQEDGVLFGRSYHTERQRQARGSVQAREAEDEVDEADEGYSDEDDCGLGSARAYHMIHKHSQRRREAGIEADVDKLPGSPSPARPLRQSIYNDGPIPRLDLPVAEDQNGSFFDPDDDPFLAKSVPSPEVVAVLLPIAAKEACGTDEDVEDSPLLQTRELEHADGKITPPSSESESSAHDIESSFVSAQSDTPEGSTSPQRPSSGPQPAVRKNISPAKRLPDPPSPTPTPPQRSLQPPAPILERPSSITSSFDLDLCQPGVELGNMKSALDRLVIDAREMTKDSISPVDIPNKSVNSEGKDAERRLSQGVFDESIVTETDGDEEDDTRELIFPTPPPISSGSYRLSRSLDLDVFIPASKSEEVPRSGHEEEEEDYMEDERAPTPVPIVKREILSPRLPELKRLSFESDMGFGSTLGSASYATPPLPPSSSRAPAPALSASPLPHGSAVSTPGTPTPKSPRSAIAERQAAIAQRKRELREAEADNARKIQLENEASERERQTKWRQQQEMVKRGGSEGRRSVRRSLSTGDAEGLVLQTPLVGQRELLDVEILETEEDGLGFDFDDRAVSSRKEGARDRKYQLREKGGVIYATSDDKVSHLGSVGDVDLGRAWRTVRRPSDMNEYSRQIKEMRQQEKPGKAYAKVFVKVLGVRLTNIPLPSATTAITCTLNNGIHFVTTPECRLGKETKIEQEFELIEHSKLEFTLTLKARRDPHIMTLLREARGVGSRAQQRQKDPSPPPRRRLGFFGSPKKAKVALPPPRPATPPNLPLPETFGRYLQEDGAFGNVFVSFKEIASRCDTRLLETSFPILCKKSNPSGEISLTIGEMIIQIFRLPPLPGIPLDQLPQSLEESIRGLRHINWHKVTYHEGTLTQLGGDCSTWRRRRLRVIGAKLVAFNDVTKKAIATIDLRKAIGVEDDQDNENQKTRVQHSDEFDALYGVERSFKLLFPKEESISFFADNDPEKIKWLQVLRALVGHIPPNPLWAELLWQKQEEEAARARHSTAPPPVSKDN